SASGLRDISLSFAAEPRRQRSIATTQVYRAARSGACRYPASAESTAMHVARARAATGEGTGRAPLGYTRFRTCSFAAMSKGGFDDPDDEARVPDIHGRLACR